MSYNTRNYEPRSGAFRVGLIFSSESQQAQVYRGECWRLSMLAERLAFSLIDLSDPDVFRALQRSLIPGHVSESLQRDAETFRTAWMNLSAPCCLPGDAGVTHYLMRQVAWNTAILTAAGGYRGHRPPLATMLYLLGMCGTYAVQIDAYARRQLGDFIDTLLSVGILRPIDNCWARVRDLLFVAEDSILVTHASGDHMPWGDEQNRRWREEREKILDSQLVARSLSTFVRADLLMLGSGKTLFDILGAPKDFIYTPQERESLDAACPTG